MIKSIFEACWKEIGLFFSFNNYLITLLINSTLFVYQEWELEATHGLQGAHGPPAIPMVETLATHGHLLAIPEIPVTPELLVTPGLLLAMAEILELLATHGLLEIAELAGILEPLVATRGHHPIVETTLEPEVRHAWVMRFLSN